MSPIPARLAASALLIALAAAGCSKGPAGPASSNPAAAAPTAAVSLAGEPCDVTFNAMLAQARHPYDSTFTTTAPGAPPKKGEARFLGDKAYYLVDGVWTAAMPTTSDKMVADLTDLRKTAKETCKSVGDDTVAGVPVAVFDVHVVNMDTTSDNRMWLSKATGLPVKTQSHLEDGRVIDTLISYDNVTAPPTGK